MFFHCRTETYMMKQKRYYGIRFERNIRKMLALAASAALALSLFAMPAMAEETGTGSITLTLEYKDEKDVLHPMKDGEVSLYTVASVKKEGGGLRYDLRGGVFADVDNAAVQAIPNMTQEEMNGETMKHTLADILATNYLTAREHQTASISNGTVSFSGMDSGLYLVVNSGQSSDKLTFIPFLMSLPDEKGNYELAANPKPGVEKPETPIPSEPSTKESAPPESTVPESTPPSPGGGNHNPGGGGGRTPRRNNPPSETTPPTDSTVLGAVRDNANDVLGAIRNPQQVLGAVRTGDPSAIFICGEILVLASAMLIGWVYAFKKLRRR